jgi:hypothetical protein
MARIRVEVYRDADGEALLRAFEKRGLSGRIVEDGGASALLEVGYASDEQTRLAGDVESALEAWIADQGVPLVPTLVENGTFVLHPPGD